MEFFQEIKAPKFFASGVKMFLGGKDFDWKTESSEKFKKIAGLAESLDISSVFLLKLSNFSSEVAERNSFEKLETKDETSESTSFYQNEKEANGVEIFPGQAAFFATADCPSVIFKSSKSEKIVCCHAGRDCLVDRGIILENKPRKNPESIIESAIGCFPEAERKTLEVFVTGGISGGNFSHSFSHLQYGEQNKALIEYILDRWGEDSILGGKAQGNISLSGLIKNQCLEYKIPAENIYLDDFDTFAEKDLNSKHLWWSHRRGDDGRNGVFVANINNN